MSFELAATSLSHLVLHQLSRKTLGVCALTTGKVCVLAVATCQTPIWWGNVDLTRLERLIPFLSLLALVFFSTLRLHFLISQKTATVTVLVQAKAAAMEGTSWASPLRQRLRPVGHPKDLTKAWGMPWPKTGASWDAFFFVGDAYCR